MAVSDLWGPKAAALWLYCNIARSQWFWAQFGPIFVHTKCQMFSFKIVFNAHLDAPTGKLLTYDVFFTPKAKVMHAFIDIIFFQTGVKSHHPIGIKIYNKGYFFFG